MKNFVKLSRNEMRNVLGGIFDYHGEPCNSHSDCTAETGPICVDNGLGGICCTIDDIHGTGEHPHPGCTNIS